MMLKGDPNQAPPVVGVTDQNRNRPYAHTGAVRCARSARPRAWARSTTTRFLLEVPASLRRQLLGPDGLHARQVDRPQLGQRRRGHADQRLRSAVQPRTVRLRREAHVQSDRDLRVCPSAATTWWGGWQTNGIVYYRTGLPLTITQTQGVQSTGTGNRPNRIGEGLADDPTIAQWFNPAHFVSPTDITGTYGDSGRQHPARAEAVQHRLLGHQGHEDRRPRHRVPRRGVQRPEPRAVRAAEHHLRQRGVRPDHGDAGQPVVRAVRHHGAEHPGRVRSSSRRGPGSREAPYSVRRRAGRREAPGPFRFQSGRRSRVDAGTGEATDARRRRGIPSGLRSANSRSSFAWGHPAGDGVNASTDLAGGGVHDEPVPIPGVIVTLDDLLPNGKRMARDVRAARFDPAPVFLRIGADNLDVERAPRRRVPPRTATRPACATMD